MIRDLARSCEGREEGKKCRNMVIFDDMITKDGTMATAINLLYENRIGKSATQALLTSRPFWRRWVA
jgi:hypothetical protein